MRENNSAQSYLKFWTGLDVQLPNNDKKRQAFPIRCYFDNDSDELINHQSRDGQVNIAVYRQLARSLKLMGYNAIDIHDQLGRREFYHDPSYRARWNYQADLNHIDALIDAIHEEGVMVQIPMYLCWQFRTLLEEQECWSRYSRDWINLWHYYMQKTPLGKGDIFLFRPRSPLWDSPYRCKCEACQSKGLGTIMTEAFAALEEAILDKNPNAILICDLYSQGAKTWQEGAFHPSDKWVMVVADNGYGKLIPPEGAGRPPHKWGVYLHAGFWMNHNVQDPHVVPLAESVRRADQENLNHYILVNGQSFKNFILNLELCAQAAVAPQEFKLDQYLLNWAERLFGKEVAADTTKLIYLIAKGHVAIGVGPAYLDKADFERGYVAIFRGLVYPLMKRISGSNDELQPIILDDKRLNKAITIWEEAQTIVDSIISRQKNDAAIAAFDDQFAFPVRITLATLRFALAFYLCAQHVTPDAIEKTETLLTQLHKVADDGTRLAPFRHWNAPQNARPVYPVPPCGTIRDYFNSKKQTIG